MAVDAQQNLAVILVLVSGVGKWGIGPGNAPATMAYHTRGVDPTTLP